MDFQEYREKLNSLSNDKDVLWNIASRKLNRGDKVGAQAAYNLADEVQKEIDVLMRANEEKPATNIEELDLKFDS